MIKDHKDLSDDLFLVAFEDGSLDPLLFNHEAHLRLAYLHVKESGADKACRIVSDQIISYVKKLSAFDNYHHTVTVASVKAVAHFMNRSKSDNFQSFIAEFPQLKTRLKSLLESHYSFEIFDSDVARKQYLEPDLQSF